MYLLLFLHVAIMFAAVSVAAGSKIIFLVATRRGDRGLIAGLSALPIDRMVPALYGLGGLFGLTTALAFGYSLLAGWLVIAYLLFVGLMVLGVGYSGPLMARLHALASDRDADPEALAQVMRRLGLDAVVSLGGLALVVADMVFKPFT